MYNLGNKEIMSRNIKYYMDLNNKTRNEICNDLGFSYSTFTDWVNGNTYPRIDKIEMLSNYFGIQKSDLVEEKTNEDKDIDLNVGEKELLKLYRNLNSGDQQMLKRFMCYYSKLNSKTKDSAMNYLSTLCELQEMKSIQCTTDSCSDSLLAAHCREYATEEGKKRDIALIKNIHKKHKNI